jgi:uncharacterized protein (DUF697 family)
MVDFWQMVRDKFLTPEVNEAEINLRLQELHKKLPVPVFWLLGKAQSGKTSLIRALTGSTSAEIGNGIKACTRTARLYDFPNAAECFLRFLDTRGLGEVNYDPTEDIRQFEDQSHLLIVVIKAADHAQQGILEPLRTIHQAHPNWPVIVVQTALHELYPSDATHADPYPFDDPVLSAQLPAELTRSLAAQRAWFAGYNARFVPVDFTLPEDGFEPPLYGLDALWSAIEVMLPLGLRGMLQENAALHQPLRDAYLRTAHPHVISYSIAGGLIAAGVPVVDLPILLGIQMKMLQSIASIYEQKLTSQRLVEIASTLGFGIIARQAGRELFKLIPGVGSVAAGGYAAASTYALGRTLCAYFSYAQQGDVPDQSKLQELYRQQFDAGQQILQSYLKRTPGGNAP